MNKVLLVEDSEDTFNLVSRALGRNIELDWAPTVKDALRLIQQETYNLLLLDVMLPDGSGFELSSIVQADDNLQMTPIIFLTAKTTTSDKVLGFSTGADDYISKPFDLLELKARVEAKLKKVNRMRHQSTQLRFGSIEVNLSSQTVHVTEGNSTHKVDLTPIEYKVLTLLIREPNRVYSRDEILDSIWGKNVHVYSRSVDTHVSKLRKKLGSKAKYIESVHGTGYKLMLPEDESQDTFEPFQMELPYSQQRQAL